MLGDTGPSRVGTGWPYPSLWAGVEFGAWDRRRGMHFLAKQDQLDTAWRWQVRCVADIDHSLVPMKPIFLVDKTDHLIFNSGK